VPSGSEGSSPKGVRATRPAAPERTEASAAWLQRKFLESGARTEASAGTLKRKFSKNYNAEIVIGNVAQFWRITRELDMGGLRETFEHPVSVRVLGSDSRTAERVARLIDPDPLAGELSAGLLSEPGRERADLFVVAVGGPLDQDARRTLSDLSVSEKPLLLVQVEGAAGVLLLGVPEERIVTLDSTTPDDEAREKLFAALVRAAPEVALPLGRRHPLVREAVAEHLIRDTARVNAQFAALSSLPANIPLVGGLVGDMADMLVLTKNQVLLLFKLAGLYGRDLELGRELVTEVLPVVGGAFVWRTAARSLIGLLPPILGLLPKTVVAYAGTFVVGEMARYYYRHGRKPPPEFVRELRQEGTRLARETLARFRKTSS